MLILLQIVSEQKSQIEFLIETIEKLKLVLKLVCFDTIFNKGIQFYLQKEVKLDNGGVKRDNDYPLSNILLDDKMKNFCNYSPNRSSKDSWISFDFKQRKVDPYSYTVRKQYIECLKSLFFQ